MNAISTSCGKLARTFSANLLDNPVIAKELRTRMRGWRAFTVMGAYVIFLAVVLLIAFAGVSAMSNYQSSGAGLTNLRIGLQLFTAITWAQTVLLAIIIPSLASGSLTGELERKTAELLVLTRLSPGRIVIGKMMSGFLYSAVLLLCSLPIAGICVMFGGISPTEVAITYALLTAWAFLLVSGAIFWSALFNKTMAATMLSYATTGAYLLMMTVISGQIAFRAVYGSASTSVPVFSALSPGWAIAVAGRNATVCGLSIPAAAIAFGMHIAVGILLLLVASTHVRYKHAERSLPIRLLLIAVTSVACWLLLGDRSITWSSGMSTNALRNVLSAFVFLVMIFLGLGTAIFATGPIRKKTGSLIPYTLSPSRIFKNDLGGSIFFIVLWAAVLCTVIVGTMICASKAYAMPLAQPAYIMWAKLTITTLSVLAAMSAVGVLASAVANRRREAVVLVILAFIIFFAIYGAILANYDNGVSNRHNPIWQLAAFWPLTPFLMEWGSWNSSPLLWWKPAQSWMVVSVVYMIVGAAALGAASMVSRRRPGIQED